MRRLFRNLLAVGAALACTAPLGHAQKPDPNAALANELIVAQLPGRSITALITHRPGAT